MPEAEYAAIASELTPGFTIFSPERRCAPVVLCSPHSGRVYPRRFLQLSRLSPQALRKSEDCFVDDLFAAAAALGVPLIAARFPRAYLDVNREPYELDPELFLEKPPLYANIRSSRVLNGLGTLARVVADGEEIYKARLPLAVAFLRLNKLYFPFHEALSGLLEATRRQYGYVVLADCHSMPSTPAGPGGEARPAFVVGDRFGASCDGRLTERLKALIEGAGYEAHLNRPYAGGYITEHYGQPERGCHALQIEINRALYMSERTLAPSAGYAGLKERLTALLAQFFLDVPAILERRAAAE